MIPSLKTKYAEVRTLQQYQQCIDNWFLRPLSIYLDESMALNANVQYLEPTAMSPFSRHTEHHTDWVGKVIVW